VVLGCGGTVLPSLSVGPPPFPKFSVARPAFRIRDFGRALVPLLGRSGPSGNYWLSATATVGFSTRSPSVASFISSGKNTVRFCSTDLRFPGFFAYRALCWFSSPTSSVPFKRLGSIWGLSAVAGGCDLFLLGALQLSCFENRWFGRFPCRVNTVTATTCFIRRFFFSPIPFSSRNPRLGVSPCSWDFAPDDGPVVPLF